MYKQYFSSMRKLSKNSTVIEAADRFKVQHLHSLKPCDIIGIYRHLKTGAVAFTGKYYLFPNKDLDIIERVMKKITVG